MRLRRHACLLLSSVLFLASCTTQPVRVESLSNAQWRARAVIRDLKAKKTHIVRVDIIAERAGRLRMDFTGSLGIYLGALTMNEKELTLVIVNQKTVYRGSSKSASFPEATPIPVNPKQILSILFEEEPEDTKWSCERDKSGLLSQCKMPEDNLMVAWSHRQGVRRTIDITGYQKEIRLDVTGVEPNTKPTAETFQMASPPGFFIKSI